MPKIEIKQIGRIIHYYELSIEYKPDFNPADGNHFRELLKMVTDLSRTKEPIRYQTFGEKTIFIQDVVIVPEQKIILGKLRCIRKDLLPEIMNLSTDEAREIEAKEDEGLVETSYFIIGVGSKTPKIAIEFNQFGAKINEFIMYLQIIGNIKDAVKIIGYRPIVKNQLDKFTERINRCSEFYVKVHKDNIEEIKALDNHLYSALRTSQDQFKSEYATLSLKFDYKKKTATPEVNNIVRNLIKGLVEDKSKTRLFNTLFVKAEDAEKNNAIECFDLLVDKLRSDIKVQKKLNHRSLVSADIYEKMRAEMIKKSIL